MPAPPLQPTGPMPFRLLLDEAMRHARRHFRAIFPSVAVAAANLTRALQAAQAAQLVAVLARQVGAQHLVGVPAALAVGIACVAGNRVHDLVQKIGRLVALNLASEIRNIAHNLPPR